MTTSTQRRQAALEIGGLITRARRCAGMTQVDVAARVSCHQSLVSHWETGVREPAVPDLMALAAVFGVPLEALLPTEAATDVRKAFEDGLRRGWRDCEQSVREALDRGRP